ncbi:MAG: valine--tRNA ligase [Parcubacteria group bacterium]|nr:valine--tRNA ligase [Parcubacteria group bacterium]
MKRDDIAKTYDPKLVEDSIYKQWEESGFFNPDNLPGTRKKSFTISMPPPNATGILHIGHAVMLAIQDLVIRYQRMQGKKALWLPGTDHAAIATQSKVERLIKEKENKTKHDLGREKFLQRVEEYVEQSRNTIKNQVKKMGSSCDWSRERFTLDADLNKAVNEAFKQMYQDELIYRGHRIINWDPNLQTTVSDDEVEYIEEQSPFYYFKYGPFEIGTSRPETKFGDKYVVMHPDDKRYKDYEHGQKIDLEWINGPITATVIKDKAIDMEFGTGVMTITPWHDAVDFEIAERHNLDKEQIIDFAGKLLPIADEFSGMPIKEARPRIVEKLKAKGLLAKVDKNYRHNIATNTRGGSLIEPQIKEQWFVDVNKKIKKLGGQSIKEKALGVVKNDDIKILPERFEKIYFHWLENLRDWCISRQIWYGHQVPVWYKGDKVEVGDKPTGAGWKQDPDTLDTWFSSGLWTFSTLGWPEKTKDLKTFHPTQLMETGYDIIFFWVARMIIMSTYLVEEIPFETVYLHGLIRDERGRKMSKSLDNIIDPLDTIKDYGADATRLSLLIGSTPGNDMNMSEAKVASYRNFVNKLWNISRYILMKVERPVLVTKSPKPKTLADRWILSELDELTELATKNLEKNNFSLVGEKIYEFTWSKLADWYVEVSKSEDEKDDILLFVLQNLLKLWHPFCPYVTEVIWQKLNTDSLLMIEPWPKVKTKIDKQAIKDFNLIQEIVVAIRNLRTESKLPPSKRLKIVIVSPKHAKLIKSESDIIKNLARLEDLEVSASAKKPAESLSAMVLGAEIYLPVSGMMDIGKEVKRLEKEVSRISEFTLHLEEKLKNQRFLERAPKDIIAAEETKLKDNKAQLAILKKNLKSLK